MWHLIGPRILVAQCVECRGDGEVRRSDLVEAVPADGERHWYTGAHSRAVRGDDGGTTNAGGIDEYFAFAFVLHERRRRDRRVELFHSGGDGAGRRSRIVKPRAVDGHHDVDAFRTAGFHRPGEIDIGECLANEVRDLNDSAEGRSLRRIEVQHQMGHLIRMVHPHERRVILDRALVREPQQGPPVVAERVGHLALRSICPQRNRLHPVRRVLRDILLHERFLSSMHTDHRQGPVA